MPLGPGPSLSVGTMARWPVGARWSASRTGRLPSFRSASPPTTTTREDRACPTSTSGDDRSGRGRWRVPSTSPCTRSGSGRNGKGSRRSRREGGALLVANHAGAIPSDAPVIMHGIEKELERPVYGLADYFFRTLPVVGTLWARSGGVSARPANAYRLLKEQQQLALVFPEGTKGPSKSFTDRYQLRRFGRGGFVEIAMRAGVPVIPIAVVGSEEAMPVLFRLPSLARVLGVPYFPITANLFAFGPLGVVTPVPGEVQAAGARPGAFRCAAGPGSVLEEPHHGGVRAHPHRSSKRPSTTCCATGAASGSAERRMSRRVLVTGADTFWGGRMIQALETDPSMDVILGMGTSVPSVPFERAEFVRADQTYSIMNRIVKATQVDTILHTFLITNSSTVPRRAMHEINVIGTMNLLAAAGAAGSSVRHIVVKSSTLVYGSAASDPNTFPEDTPRTSPVQERRRTSAHRSRGPRPRLRRGQSGNPRDRASFRQRPRDPPHDPNQPKSFAAGLPVDLRIRPSPPIH